ncbi:amino acid transporter AVT1D-like [Lytechinus variegatus]|uniref:amino acid transporter AVT1D-like n=1 Tax=Lytechinus variegatus TaxID=7654 RepID=UPI001BB156C2|nr:amino acid transporter AVT1D-like [Lytechinus variegatus]XP_041453351.1 amino acid transporter AVT1D-like [Lytechinus variegatus]
MPMFDWLKMKGREDEESIISDTNKNTSATNMIEVAKGLGTITTGIFIVGEMAGTGVLALPRAIVDAGWFGLPLIIIAAIMSAYTGVVLGRCWTIIKDRFPEKYAGHTRYPYPAIGFEAYGKIGSYIVTFCVNATLFGVSTVFLLLAASNMELLVGKGFSFCYWLPIIAACLIPLTWFGTPKDFWPVAIGAMAATSIACILLFIQIMTEIHDYPDTTHTSPSFVSFFVAFGTIIFAFGGHAAFPTIQHDMREPKSFPKSIALAYSIIVMMYFPVAAAGYFVYGDLFITMNTDYILDVIYKGVIHKIVTTMILLHLVLGFVIVINPFCQQIEEALHIPLQFSWKRMILRTLVVGLVLFTGETIPHFGAILSLVGGSTVTFLTFVFPSLFYLRLLYGGSHKDPSINDRERHLAIHHKVIHAEIILVGVLGGVASTYSVIYSIASGQSQFTVPCYVNITAAHL